MVRSLSTRRICSGGICGGGSEKNAKARNAAASPLGGWEHANRLVDNSYRGKCVNIVARQGRSTKSMGVWSGGFSCFFSLVTSIILSLVLTVVLNLILRALNR